MGDENCYNELNASIIKLIHVYKSFLQNFTKG